MSEVVTPVGLPGARVVFSSRHGGVSEGPYQSLNLGISTGDDRERVAVNRGRLAAFAGIAAEQIAMGWQVHGSDLQAWSGPPTDGRGAFAAPGAELPRVDGHLTAATGVGLVVLVADCLPVALAGSGQVAMLHCGWRGLADGIVERALEAFPRPPAAAVGPGIGPCCYEVGEEVLAAFDEVADAAHGCMLDLRAVVVAKLEASGVRAVEHLDRCTSCRPDLYFSHRRDGGATGRQCGLVWRER